MEDFAGVYPDLDAYAAVGRVCLSETVVDVSSDSLKRNGTLTVVLGTCYFSTAETAGYLGLYTLDAAAHCASDRELHSTAEGYTLFELGCDALCNECCIDIGILDLNDIDVNILIGLEQFLALDLQLLDLLTLCGR